MSSIVNSKKALEQSAALLDQVQKIIDIEKGQISAVSENFGLRLQAIETTMVNQVSGVYLDHVKKQNTERENLQAKINDYYADSMANETAMQAQITSLLKNFSEQVVLLNNEFVDEMTKHIDAMTNIVESEDEKGN